MKVLKKGIEEHEDKIEQYEGKDYILRDYWEKEIKSFKNKKEEQERKLKK